MRPDPYGKLKPVAANIDCILLVIAPFPEPSALLVDRYLVACELTGATWTPDGRTMFINVQHPGEDGKLTALTSNWPDSQTTAGSTKRPRSATVVVTRKDGGAIGV